MLIAVDPQIAPTALDNILANVRQAGMVVVSTNNVKRAIANARGIKDITRTIVCEMPMEMLDRAIEFTDRHWAATAKRLKKKIMTKITKTNMSTNGCLNHGTRTDLSVSVIL